MGTNLEAAGLPCDPPLWSALPLRDHPQAVSALHRAFAMAGAEIHIANTFRTRESTFAASGAARDARVRAEALTARAVSLARGAAPDAFVFGSLGPVADCYHPEWAPADPQLRADHEAHARCLAAAGCDGIWVETQNSSQEALIATRAAVATGLPVFASFVCDDRGRLLSGDALEDACDLVAEAGARGVGLNCTTPAGCEHGLPALLDTGLPISLAPNLAFDPGRVGAADPDPNDDAPRETSPERFAARGRGWLRQGVRILGGCCGCTPAHLAALGSALAEESKRASG